MAYPPGDELGDQIGAGHTTAALFLENATNISEEGGAQALLFLNAARRKRYMSSLCRDGAAGDLSQSKERAPIIRRAIEDRVGNVRIALADRIGVIGDPARSLLRDLGKFGVRP